MAMAPSREFILGTFLVFVVHTCYAISLPLFVDRDQPGVAVAEVVVDGRTFRVFVDVRTQGLALPSTTCDNCGEATTKLDPSSVEITSCESASDCRSGVCSEKDPKQCEFGQEFGGDYSIVGVVSSGSIELDRETHKIPLGLIHHQQGFVGSNGEDQNRMGRHFDGVLGIGRMPSSPCPHGCLPSALDAWFESTEASKKLVAFGYSRNGGILDIGDIRSVHYTGDPQYFPSVNNSQLYELPLESMTSDDDTLDIAEDDKKLSLATSVQEIFFPKYLYDLIKSSIQESQDMCDLKFVCSSQSGDSLREEEETIFGEQSCANYEESDLDKFPILAFRLSQDATLRLGGRDYFVPTKISNETYYCFTLRPKQTESENGIILGLSGMTGLYVIFDAAQNRIGLADLSSGGEQGCDAFFNCEDCTAHTLCGWCDTPPKCIDQPINAPISSCPNPTSTCSNKASPPTSTPLPTAAPTSDAPSATRSPTTHPPADTPTPGSSTALDAIRDHPRVSLAFLGLAFLLIAACIIVIIRRRRQHHRGWLPLNDDRDSPNQLFIPQ